MAYYRVQISSSIQGCQLENSDIPYTYYGIQTVQTLDNDYKPNIVYRIKDRFSYCIYLNQPNALQILHAKELIKQQMLKDLQLVIDNLNSIKNKIENTIIE